MNSLSDKIINRMEEMPKGTIYANNDFYDLGNSDAIRQSLSRLTNENKIYRLIDGYYTIPYYIEIIHEYSYPSNDELAKKIADKYAWNIAPYEDTALNRIGISTQVPVAYEYISDGPYREYEYMDKTIKFKHTANRNISPYSQQVSLIIQSIKAIGKDNITDKHIQIIKHYKDEYVYDDLLKETKSLPVWVYNIIKIICEETMNE
ncbi:MAG: DUF6088 family protein [Erysipelotrichaceae bacterium]|nr:DUF6088 family protein [Erysipelotrichaceae bacterium]